MRGTSVRFDHDDNYGTISSLMQQVYQNTRKSSAFTIYTLVRTLHFSKASTFVPVTNF